MQIVCLTHMILKNAHGLSLWPSYLAANGLICSQLLTAGDAAAGTTMSKLTQNAGKTGKPAVGGAAWLQMTCWDAQHPPAPAEPSGLPIATEPPAHTHGLLSTFVPHPNATPKVSPKVNLKVTPKTSMHSCTWVSALPSHIQTLDPSSLFFEPMSCTFFAIDHGKSCL